MKNTFQIVLLVGFIVAGIFGVLVFSGFVPIGEDSGGVSGSVVLWGTFKSIDVAPALEQFNLSNKDLSVSYVEKNPESFDRELLEALASGRGPDIFFLPDDLIFSYRDKIIPIPYQNISESTFKKNFISASDVFLSPQGIMALPVAVDPMMMYYNRSMFDASGLINPPAFWDEFPVLVDALTNKDEDNRILKSAVALGQFANVNHAKEILSTMFMQTGNPVITYKDGFLVSTLNNYNPKYDLGDRLEFFTDFTNPNKDIYTWNRSFPSSRDAFSAENLAVYFGPASELKFLENKNPNQDIAVAPFPQIRNELVKVTNARVTGIAVSGFSRNIEASFAVANLLTSGLFPQNLSKSLGIVPARRDLLTQVPTESFFPVFYNSALFSRTWLDPDPVETDNIFRAMIDKANSNVLNMTDAVRDADSRMWLLLATGNNR